MTQNYFQMITSAVSDRGLSEKRPQNEDSYLEMPEHGIFAVADGVGGAQAGDTASQMAMEILAEAFTNLPEGGDVEEMMQSAISHANTCDLSDVARFAATCDDGDDHCCASYCRKYCDHRTRRRFASLSS